MLDLVKFVISCAISTSRIRELASERFSSVVPPKLFTVWVKRFCAAPNWARWSETFLMAESMLTTALSALNLLIDAESVVLIAAASLAKAFSELVSPTSLHLEAVERLEVSMPRAPPSL